MEYGNSTSATTDSPRELLLEFDDGNTLTMREEGAMIVPASAEFSCLEVQWQGTAGDMSRRTGTFEWLYDSIQTTLHLVED